MAHERGAGETAHGGGRWCPLSCGTRWRRRRRWSGRRNSPKRRRSCRGSCALRRSRRGKRARRAADSARGRARRGIAQGSRAAGGPHRKRPRRRAVSRTRRHGARRCRTAAMREPVRPAGACRPPGFRPRSRARRRRASPIDQHPHRVFPLTLRRGPATLYGVGRVFIQSRLPNSAWTSQISRTVDAFAGVSWHLAAVAGGGVSTGGAAGRRARRRRGGRPGCGPGR